MLVELLFNCAGRIRKPTGQVFVERLGNVMDFGPRALFNKPLCLFPDIRLFRPSVRVEPHPQHLANSFAERFETCHHVFCHRQHRKPQPFRCLFTDGDFGREAAIAVPA